MTDIGFLQVDEFRLRAQPARDADFRVAPIDGDMHDHAELSDIGRREMLHRHMSNEITSIDIAAACIAEFPDAPWDLRMELARQCADEGRHVRVLFRRLREIGGFKGEFPISTLEWSVTCSVDNLPGRLGIQNRTLEAGAMDIVAGLALAFRRAGDDTTANILDGINADEVQHVRFANRWIKRLAADNPRVLMQLASALSLLSAVNNRCHRLRSGRIRGDGAAPVAAPVTMLAAIHVEARTMAEFSEDEIQAVLRQAGFRSFADTPEPG